MEEFQLKTDEIIDRTLEKYAQNHDWFSQSEERHRAEWIEYQLKNPKYKNEVSLYQIITVRNLLLVLNQFRNDAIGSYLALYDTINSDEELPDFIP